MAPSYPCEQCGRIFTLPSNLKVHMRVHSAERPFVCGTCGKAFSQLGNLHVHEAVHTGERPHACPHCPFRTALASSLRKHIGRHHTDLAQKSRELRLMRATSSQLECEVCHVLLTSPAALLCHRKSHPHVGQDRRHPCPECDYSTDDRTQLGNHLLTHSGEKPYACELCGKAFAIKYSLKTHLRTHTGEKPYVCVACGKGFSQSHSLRAHERTHSGEKPYLCGVCGKTFATLSSLQVHCMSHSLEKGGPSPSEGQLQNKEKEACSVARKKPERRPFSCELCGKAFAQKGHLKRHADTHSGESPFECQTCGKRFTREDNLRKHGKTHKLRGG